MKILFYEAIYIFLEVLSYKKMFKQLCILFSSIYVCHISILFFCISLIVIAETLLHTGGCGRVC